MTLWLLAIGVVSMLGQVVILRELSVAFYGTELIYILALGVWLLGSGAGAAFGRRDAVPSGARVQWLLLALALGLPAILVLVRGLRRIFRGVPGAYLPFPTQMIALAVALLPVALALGLLFRWAAKRFAAGGGSLAAAYAIESAGGVAGGLLATISIAWGLSNFSAGIVCALLALAAALSPWDEPQPRGMRWAAGASAVLLMACLTWSPSLDLLLTSWNHPALRASVDTPYGRLTVEDRAGQVAIFENDALSYESEGTGAEEFVHVAAIQREAPEEVLVLGGGAEGLVRELLLHAPRRVDYVELDRTWFSVVFRSLPEEDRRALTSGIVDLTLEDGRRFLRSEGAWDLILVGMPEPDSGRTNRFYTREFFALCAARLEPGGVLAFRLRGAENLWTPGRIRRASGIHAALKEVFPEVVVLPGVTNTFLASQEPLERDPRVLGERLRSRGVEGRLVIPEYVEYLYRNDRFHEIERLLASSESRPNTDARPICYLDTLILWLSMFYPEITFAEWSGPDPSALLKSPWTWVAALVTAVLLVLARFRLGLRRLLLAGAAGLIGMILETALILDYQTREGVLFRDLGLLLTLFMAGLALGAGTMNALAGRNPEGGSRAGSRWAGALILILAVALCGGAAWALRDGRLEGWAGTALLLLLGGFLTAALFAHASHLGRPVQGGIVGPLYAADLIGGCAGSVVASLLLIPVLGAAGTSGVLVAVAAGALLLL